MPARDLPAAANVDVLRQGIELLTRLDDPQAAPQHEVLALDMVVRGSTALRRR